MYVRDLQLRQAEQNSDHFYRDKLGSVLNKSLHFVLTVTMVAYYLG